MSLLTVLRVEDDQHKGPYIHQTYRSAKQAKIGRALAGRHTDGWLLPVGTTVLDRPELHPGPEEDYGMQVRWRMMDWSKRRAARQYIFGFADKARMRQWFFGERDTLELLNMHVAAYEVPHQAVLRGQWQVAFRKPSARLVRTMTLKEAGIE